MIGKDKQPKENRSPLFKLEDQLQIMQASKELKQYDLERAKVQLQRQQSESEARIAEAKCKYYTTTCVCSLGLVGLTTYFIYKYLNR